jgi:ArsR family transcriptional regulator, arsenate/arsenite/antimonite-responsive transcriptional repressor
MKRPSATGGRAAVDQLEEVFKALADKTRLRILALLGNDEVCVCHMHDSLGLPQPTVSRHLAYLRRSGLVAARRDGVWMHYQISRSLDPLVRGIVGSAIDALKQLPATTQDRKQFQKSFGQLYVLDSPSGGSCCAPRALDSNGGLLNISRRTQEPAQ